MNITVQRRPKLLYLVTEDAYFWSHRLPMARAARDGGFDVLVATRVRAHGARVEAEGFRLRPLRWRRGGLAPWRALRELAELVRLYRRERPDIVHHVALKPTVFGTLAARLTGVPTVVNGINGLGFAFTSRTPRARLSRGALRLALRLLLGRDRDTLIAQNPDDAGLLLGAGVVDSERLVLIPGSGIDTAAFAPLPAPPAPPVTVAVTARMLVDKGIPTLVEAHRRLRRRGHDVRLVLAGAPDPENPSTIPAARLEAWAREPGIEWPGHVDDVRALWARAHIAVLPSRREGLPKSLLEAAACGRPLVASDVPGCREIARHGVNALLVPPDDPAALADALATLAADPDLRRRYGAAGRRLVEEVFTAERIGRQTLALYRRLLAAPGTAPEAPDLARHRTEP